jgi:hypothetical protein
VGKKPEKGRFAKSWRVPCLAFPSDISSSRRRRARAFSCDVSGVSALRGPSTPWLLYPSLLLAPDPKMAVGCFNPVLSPLVPSPPRSRLRAALRSHSHQPTAVSLRLLPSGAAAGRGTWRLAAAAESQAVQEQQARTEEPGEAGGPGAAEASSKLVLVVGGTGGVGEIPIYLMFVLLLPLRICVAFSPRQRFRVELQLRDRKAHLPLNLTIS